MTKLNITIIISILAFNVLYARIGDTPPLAESRYGKPTNESEIGSISTKEYERNGFHISVIFTREIATGIVYNNPDLPLSKVTALMNENTSGLSWKSDISQTKNSDTKLWMRSDRKATATWNPKEGSLRIIETETLAAFKKEVEKLARTNAGSEPYTPTRMEWLIVYMNSEMKQDNLSQDNFTISFTNPIDPYDPNTILILVMYTSAADHEYLSLLIQSSESRIKDVAKSKDWEWLNIKTEMVKIPDRNPPMKNQREIK